MIAGVNGQRGGATLGWTAIDAANIAVGELAAARGEGSVPEELILSVPMTTA